jgi:hypothetical protein
MVFEIFEISVFYLFYFLFYFEFLLLSVIIVIRHSIISKIN